MARECFCISTVEVAELMAYGRPREDGEARSKDYLALGLDMVRMTVDEIDALRTEHANYGTFFFILNQLFSFFSYC